MTEREEASNPFHNPRNSFHMAYEILNTASVVPYLKSVAAMQDIFSGFDNLEVVEAGNGNLNYVYRITNPGKPNERVILKQAVPYLRVVGESWPLTRERMRFEIQALEKHRELCPGLVPEIFHANTEMSLVIMQDLAPAEILRDQIIEGKSFPRLADDISTFLANTLFHTSDWFLGSKEKKEAVGRFINKELCDLTEDFVFTHPFERHETNVYNEELSAEDLNYIHRDGALKVAVAELKYTFMNHAEAMLHGDLHTGSIMTTAERTFVIDPEFAFYGPMGFDIGAIIGNLFMSYFSHEYRQKLLGREPFEYRNWILETIESTWKQFEEKFDALWAEHQQERDPLYFNFTDGDIYARLQRKQFLEQVFSDTLGFAACKMIRRIFGLAKVADIADIKDLKERARVERMTLQLGKLLATRRSKFKSIEEVIHEAKILSPLH